MARALVDSGCLAARADILPAKEVRQCGMPLPVTEQGRDAFRINDKWIFRFAGPAECKVRATTGAVDDAIQLELGEL